MRSLLSRLSFATALVLTPLAASPAMASSEPIAIPAPALDASRADSVQTAVLAGGCFWGVQAVYQHTTGVVNAVSGYAGGAKETANYKRTNYGDTGHAEAVEITYDPKKISYGKLLQIYFSVVHDPTQLNRQGPDVGTQYRSTIFAQNDEQKRVAEAYIAQLNAAKAFKAKIATTIETGKPFYKAEDYHQDYATLNPLQPYILINDKPKIGHMAKYFPDNFRTQPVLVKDVKAVSN
ncbi:peptide-methionine (S)-S-oxide reductase MsrA [Bradyrhizobium sp. LHD-71]|uniref:peptide-methionine (S)-S-oxide reductase MsrA n=1 Tax=Bradyrhizobium sp. LHD-71 TaxID=3072141 RepID=UPI00280C5F3B|nr:peptide-methionine (S)-S-oxide reductase MsrA [Bradyrhizobium sp. LHD-71]MDQ8728128.1 peptide-methionine (S)-S-oxide reductase MsrA [Bradyrhizobium sp. LHD-71]